MADLTADADIRILGKAYTERFIVETTAAVTYYRGQPAMVIQLTDATGPIVPWVDSEVKNDDVFMGIIAEGGSVLIAAAETQEVECYVGPTIIGFKSTGIFTAGHDYGAECYKSDSDLLSATIGDNPRLGKVWKVEGDYVFVRLETPYICAGA